MTYLLRTRCVILCAGLLVPLSPLAVEAGPPEEKSPDTSSEPEPLRPSQAAALAHVEAHRHEICDVNYEDYH